MNLANDLGGFFMPTVPRSTTVSISSLGSVSMGMFAGARLSNSWNASKSRSTDGNGACLAFYEDVYCMDESSRIRSR